MLLEIGLTVGFVVSGHILAVIEDQVLAPSRYRVDFHNHFVSSKVFLDEF